MKTDLPDFLHLTEDQLAAEKSRQESLRRDFNSRVRMSSVESEFVRASILEDGQRESLKTATGEERDRLSNSFAETLAMQGRFLEALETASDSQAKLFYEKAAEAVFNNIECSCGQPIHAVGRNQVRLPKFRVIKEIYSLKHAIFGFLSECNTCGQWAFMGSNPLPNEIDPATFDPATTPNDSARLKV